MKKIVIATKNAGKVREMKDAFAHLPVEVVALSEFGQLPNAIEDGETFAENAAIKARFYQEKTGCACLADDSGLCVDALDGAPGVYSARFAPNRDFDKGMDLLLAEMDKSSNKSRKAHFSCVISLAFPGGEYKLFEGRVNGQIATHKMLGDFGFGYDPLFIPNGYDCSFAQMDKAQKNSLSHRGKAMKKLKEYLINRSK